MKFEYIPVKGQKFDIGRTINPFNCDCPQCTFLTCPKKNYAVKMTRKKYTVDDFWRERKDDVLKLNHPKRWQYSFPDLYSLRLSYDLINDFFEFLCPNFPKGTYWNVESSETDGGEDIGNTIYKDIVLVKFSRAGKEINLGRIRIAGPDIYDYDLNDRQHKLAETIHANLLALKEKIIQHYQDTDKDWRIGWLSPEGRHYPCDYGDHALLARTIGGGELMLETLGWAKIALRDEEGFFLHRRNPSPEQRNWLSAQGYNLDEMFG